MTATKSASSKPKSDWVWSLARRGNRVLRKFISGMLLESCEHMASAQALAATYSGNSEPSSFKKTVEGIHSLQPGSNSLESHWAMRARHVT